MPERHRIVFSPEAAAHLEAIHRYISVYSEQNANSMVGKLVDAIDSLDFLPHRYPLYRGRRQIKDDVRRMPVGPYLIYYRVIDRNLAVEVIAIRHGKRGPQSF